MIEICAISLDKKFLLEAVSTLSEAVRYSILMLLHLVVEVKKQWSVILYLSPVANTWTCQFTLSDFAILLNCTPVPESQTGSVVWESWVSSKCAERLQRVCQQKIMKQKKWREYES